MRLVVMSPYADPVRGGITSYTRELVVGYRNLGIETLGLARSGETNTYFDVLGGTKFGFCIKAMMRVLREKPDVAHGHSHWYALVPCLLAKVVQPKTRVIFTFHTPPIEEEEDLGTFTRLKRRLFHTLVRFCDAVTFVSRDAEKAMALPPYVPHGVVHAAPERLFGSSPSSHGDSPRQLTILAISVLIWPKKVEGVLILLDAFKIVAPSFPDWRLVIVGDGPLRRNVEDRVELLGLNDRVFLRGFVDDVRGELESAGVFAQISLQEGLPIALLDAMAFGAPVIATAIGAMPEVVKNGVTGYIVEPTKEAVSGAMRELLQDPELRRRIGATAKAWTAAELSWEKVALRNLELAGMTAP